MPRACLVEFHARGYQRLRLSSRCNELVSWSFTLVATVAANVRLHETSSWSLENSGRFFVATNVKLHDARSWHLYESCLVRFRAPAFGGCVNNPHAAANSCNRFPGRFFLSS